ncbi:MAG: ATP-binding protein [Candidatus Diapherotrites archaeon]
MTEKEIGTVISTLDSPSPSLVRFVVNEGIVHRGQFVEMQYSEGTLIALVSNVVKTNRYFERADSVKEFESDGKALIEQFPTTEWEFLVAETKPLGVFTEKLTKRSTYPPSPGTKVKIATKENLKKFFSFDEKNGLHLGEIEYHENPVQLNMTKLLQKHCAVLAQSGFGKSYLIGILLEELLERKKDEGRIATIVLDVHGEYTSFAEPITDKKHKDYSNKTRLVRAREIKIGVPKISAGMLASILPGLSAPQKRDLGKVITKLQKEMREGLGPYNLNAIKSELLQDESIKENTQKALIGWIMELEELHIFSEVDAPSIEDVVGSGLLTVIDLSDIINLKKKQIIVNYLAHKLFDLRRKKIIPPFLLVLEEAHQFIPEKAGRESAIARYILETIAREGRKFGASLCLISQRPIQLSTTVLSQCNTHIILRITNPYDLKHIGESSEGLDQRALEMITVLRVGEALMLGEATGFPLFFKVRERKSLESKHEKPLEKAAVEFEEGNQKKEDEAKEFL